MKNSQLFIFGVLLLLPVLGFGQLVDSTEKYAEFKCHKQGIWGKDSDFSLDINKSLFRLKWNNSGNSGKIATLAGMKFGGEIDASTWGDIGANFILDGFTAGSTDIFYPLDVKYFYPKAYSFTNGETVTLSSKYNVKSNASLDIENPSVGKAELRMHVGFGFDVAAKLCLFGCKSFHIIPNINLPVQDFYLIHIDSSGLVYPCANANWFCSDYDDPSTCERKITAYSLPGFCKKIAAPYKLMTPGGEISGSAALPYNELVTTDRLVGRTLYAEGEYQYLNVTVDVFGVLSLIPIPVVSTVLGNLNNDFTLGGYGKFGYNIFDMDFPINNYHKHEFYFKPEIYNKIRLSTQVNYEVKDQNGNKLDSGKDSIITYPLESDIQIKIPCNSAFVDVMNYDFQIGDSKNFSNHTYDSLSFELAMSALSFYIKLPEVEVVPRLCFPKVCVKIPYPCPTWRKPWKWCSKKKCTPAFCTPSIVFEGLYFGVGPLWEYNKQLAFTKYDWYKSDWSMGGFSPYSDTTKITRLLPVEFIVEVDKRDILCYGESTGKVGLKITGGSAPYYIEWSDGTKRYINNQEDSLVNIKAGSYFVKITDKNGCQVFNSIDVEEPSMITSKIKNVEDVLCFGDNSGSADLEVAGGTQPYAYNWTKAQSSFNSGTKNIKNISAGQYYVEITDKNGCIAEDSVSITEPKAALSAVLAGNDVPCHGDATGFASAEVNGGTPPYAFKWSNNDTTEVVENLTAGTYTLNIEDANGCKLSDQVKIDEPLNALALSTSKQDVNCHGGETGNIDLTVNGGTTPYNYIWTNENQQQLTKETEDLENISAGDYRVVVTDDHECRDTAYVSILEPTPMEVKFSTVNVSCFGGNSGSIITKVSGGIQPYTYKWNDGPLTGDRNAVNAGTYHLEILDSAACSLKDSVTISEPDAPLQASIEAKHIKCFGVNSGGADLSVTGGTEPYKYTWSNGDTLPKLANLEAGTYTVTIEDAHNCMANSGVVIMQPDTALHFDAITKDASCFGQNDGEIRIDADGGTPPYYFQWDDTLYVYNENAEKLKHLERGVYHIVVSDRNDCTEEDWIEIRQPDSLSLTYITEMVSCFNGSDGSIDISVSGGTQPYDYNWSNGSKSEDINQVSAGFYDVWVLDAQDCQVKERIRVDQYPPIEASYDITDISCSDQSDGAILLDVSGGVGDFQYKWSSGEQTKNIFDKEVGFYSVVITDSNNCKLELNDLEVYFNESVCINIPSSFTPNGDGVNDTWILRNIELYPEASVKIFNRWGNMIFESTGYVNPWDGLNEGKKLPAATYYYVIDLKDGEKPYTGSVTIVR